MNLFEAKRIMFKNGYRFINEMAKAAKYRIFDELSDTKKAIFILSDFEEFCQKQHKPIGKATINQLNDYVSSKVEQTGMNWSDFKEALIETVSFPAAGRNPHIENTSLMSLISSPRYRTIVNSFKTAITNSKDDIDSMVDNVFNYREAINNGEEEETAYRENNIEAVVDWIKSDPTEAEDRFGYHWNKIQQLLKPYLMDNYAGSEDEAFMQFIYWYKAMKAGNEREIPEQYLSLLVDIAMDESSVERFGNMVWQLRRTAQKWLGHTLEEELENRGTPLQREIRRIINDMRNNMHTTNNSTHNNTNGRIDLTNFTFTPEIITCVQELADDPENIDTDYIGRVDKNKVVSCYKYCLNTLNRRYHVGRNGIYKVGIQEFYNTYKLIFKTGFTLSAMYQVFDKVSEFLLNQLDTDTANYWNSQRDIDDVEDFNMDEAIKLLRRNGYRIIK